MRLKLTVQNIGLNTLNEHFQHLLSDKVSFSRQVWGWKKVFVFAYACHSHFVDSAIIS